jgi:uncharacterized iron-regulated membrane protein
MRGAAGRGIGLAAGRSEEWMMSAPVLRRWILMHKWTSLVCTIVLLVLCITGLPLIFAEEIQDWSNDTAYAAVPEGTSSVSLDKIAATSHAMYPNEIVTSVSIDDDEPKVIVRMAPSWDAFANQPKSRHWIQLDARTAKVLDQSKALAAQSLTFLEIALRLHSTLFLDISGELCLAVVALLFLAATASGVVLYGPFMRKFDFGSVRVHRTARLKWLDLHNLLGVVTLAWTLIVGATGFINAISVPLFTIWQTTDVRHALAPWQNETPSPQSELSSLQDAFDTAKRALPGTLVTGIVFPGSPFGSPHHYLFWAKGETPLTHRLFNPVLVDATSGKMTAILAMPWYLRALEVSRPLHFGDYGGLPLKIIWGLLDLATILVLGSGLYLWFSRRKWQIEADFAEMEIGGAGTGLGTQGGGAA